MHPNRQSPAHFVVHVLSCLHLLFRVARPLHSNWQCKGINTCGMFPRGCEDTVAPRRLLCKGVGGLWTEARGQQKQSNNPGNNQHILNMPTIGRC